MWEYLLKAIADHRRKHNLPIGLGFADEVEAQVCQNQPEMCADTDPTIPKARNLGLSDIMHGMAVMASWKLAGSPLVPQQEANRRAEICSKCRMNVVFSRPCGTMCGQLKNAVHALVGKVATPFDNELKSCSICACFTSAHVWLPLTYLDKGLTDDMRAQFLVAKEKWGCWKVTQPQPVS